MTQIIFSISRQKRILKQLLKRQTLALFLVFMSVFSICSGQKPMMDDMEYWRLSYRMLWNVELENNVELAEKQLDSMLAFGNVMEDKILYVGIKCLHKNNKMDRIKTMLTEVDTSTFAYLCSKDLFKNELKNLVACENYYQDEKVDNPELQRKLAIMFIDDQNVRMNRMDGLIKKYNVSEQELIALDDYKTHVDLENQKKLKEIIIQYGFPTKKLVGKDGMEAIFHIIQHAGDDLEWQAAQLQKVENAVKIGDMEMKDYVYLYDRIKLHANLPQRWGTQCSSVNKKENLVILHTVEDLVNLDKRRKEVGLEPIDFYKKIMLHF
jgi:hypothetical protein